MSDASTESEAPVSTHGDPPLLDDLGAPVPLSGSPRRVVSLVPSLTEALAATAPEVLVGATDWCTHPPELAVTRVRGTKNPNLQVIADLSPDLVIANKEENRELDVRRLRERGIAVWVTDIETVPQSIDSMERLICEGIQRDIPAWLSEARTRWSAPTPPLRARIAVPIWRDPWMVVGPSTYTSDLLRRLGYDNVFAGTSMSADDRYPAVELAALDDAGIDEVWLPDEPYVFTDTDGPEAFARVPTRLVSGRLLTWYGPAMVEAHRLWASP